MGGVTGMSLPDATRSDRVYPLLQNLDLENLAFATLQGTGQTLNIEEMNEDELRRLVLVNLARLTVKGEWNGLLTAAAGGLASVLAPLNIAQTEIGGGTWDNYPLSVGAGGQTSSTVATPSTPYYYPFVVTKAGSIDEIKCYVGTADSGKNILVGIYDSVNGVPKNKISTTTISVNATGASSANPDTTTTFVVGTQYFVAFVESGSSNSGKIYGSVGDGSTCQFPVGDSGLFDGGNTFYQTGGATYALADPVDPDGLNSMVTKVPRFWFTYS